MTKAKLRREIKNLVDQLPPERLNSLADYVHFLNRPSLGKRLEDAEKAIEAFNGKDFAGRPLTVNEARPMVKKEFTNRMGRSNRW